MQGGFARQTGNSVVLRVEWTASPMLSVNVRLNLNQDVQVVQELIFVFELIKKNTFVEAVDWLRLQVGLLEPIVLRR